MILYNVVHMCVFKPDHLAVPGTGNLTNYSVLVKLWLLEENLQPLTY